MKRLTLKSHELAKILLRDARISMKMKAEEKRLDKAIKQAEVEANSRNWDNCSDYEEMNILIQIAYNHKLPYGMVIEKIDDKYEAIFTHEEWFFNYIEFTHESFSQIGIPEIISVNQPVITATYVAIISAIITEIRKSKLYRLSVPYPQIDLIHETKPSFIVQNILAVFEGFSLPTFSRPPPTSTIIPLNQKLIINRN
ncbi:hypothetical protein [Algoriphagus sp. PAP.12]|uniref:hypothetical protein n=1 Tax=Algoriphagus sp. PAP.12 TaxID=2996678 RepID=UPI00227B88AE|nr:hypothetical protein [Algoriphagus sp. PAP.12]